MTLTTREKANRYDVLMAAINLEKMKYEDKLRDIDSDLSTAFDGVAGLCIGRKYAYIEFIELLERWQDK